MKDYEVLQRLAGLEKPVVQDRLDLRMMDKLKAAVKATEGSDVLGVRVPGFINAAFRARAEREGRQYSDLLRGLVNEYVLDGFVESWTAAVDSGAVTDAELDQFEMAANGWMGRGWPGDPEADLISPTGEAWHCTYDANGALVSKTPLKVPHG